jgi:hypothetical protein
MHRNTRHAAAGCRRRHRLLREAVSDPAAVERAAPCHAAARRQPRHPRHPRARRQPAAPCGDGRAISRSRAAILVAMPHEDHEGHEGILKDFVFFVFFVLNCFRR